MHRAAHQAGIRSTATMMYGHVETPAGSSSTSTISGHSGRDARLHRLRAVELQARQHADGSRVPRRRLFDVPPMLAASRLYLDSFDRIQATWFSEGEKTVESRSSSARTTSAARCSRRTSTSRPATTTRPRSPRSGPDPRSQLRAGAATLYNITHRRPEALAHRRGRAAVCRESARTARRISGRARRRGVQRPAGARRSAGHAELAPPAQ